MTEKRTAIIDIGSNTIRLVIFSVNDYGNVNEIQNIKNPARLVQYLDDQQLMSAEGIAILVDVVENFLSISEAYTVEDVSIIATAAVRQSKNQKEIKNLLEEKTGHPLHILSEKEEAYYGNYAIRHTMAGQDGLSIDIGGGSTELVCFHDKKLEKSISLPFGAVSLAEKFFQGKDYNDKKAIKRASNWIEKQLAEVAWLTDSRLPIYAIGGSARNIADVYQRSIDYPIAGLHEFEMSAEALNETLILFKQAANKKDMLKLDGLSKDRVDTIIPATLVFQSLMTNVQAPSLHISKRGLREGILLQEINQSSPHAYTLQAIQPQAIVRTARKYNIASFAVKQRMIIANALLRELAKYDFLQLDQDEMDFFCYAVILYNLGAYIENDAKAQHTFYILSNINLHGFSHRRRVALALIASFKNKSLFKQNAKPFTDWFTSETYDLLLKLGGIIKFADALSDAQVNHVQRIHLEKLADKHYKLTVAYSGKVLSEDYRGNKQKKHLERVLDGTVDLKFIEELV